MTAAEQQRVSEITKNIERNEYGDALDRSKFLLSLIVTQERELAEAIAQRDEALSKLQDIGTTVDGLEVVRDLYQRERDKAHADFRKFGRHIEHCAMAIAFGGHCTCGFTAALAL